jgi:hypothetical protein
MLSIEPFFFFFLLANFGEGWSQGAGGLERKGIAQISELDRVDSSESAWRLRS